MILKVTLTKKLETYFNKGNNIVLKSINIDKPNNEYNINLFLSRILPKYIALFTKNLYYFDNKPD